MASFFFGFVLEHPDLEFSFEGMSDIDIFRLQLAELVDGLFAIEWSGWLFRSDHARDYG